MSSLRPILVALAILAGLCSGAAAAGYSALARVDSPNSSIVDRGDAVEIELRLSQPVPWRVFTLNAPRRLILELGDAIWSGPVSVETGRVSGVRTGRFQPGWSRMVVDLEEPLAIEVASLGTVGDDGGARLFLRLVPVSDAEFAARARGAETVRSGFPGRKASRSHQPDLGPQLRVVVDPGHGGFDPGARVDGLNEASLMLTFALELRELLRRTKGIEATLTRDADEFVPLERRLSIAREAQADVFISLHADALVEGFGNASGATVYTLSDEASDDASQQLAERHDGDELLAGVDLSGQGDEIAIVLMEMARTETDPRSDRLAGHLVDGIMARAGRVNNSPLRSAAFSVLKLPDIPSVLVELGFLSSARDRDRLTSPQWRSKAAEGIRDGLLAWAAEDAAQRRRNDHARRAR